MIKKTMTIDDIAHAAGVGKSTVSRVINGNGYVSAETAKKVKTAMKLHSYQPSAVARSLSRQESDVIGLILPEVNNPFFSDILLGVCQMADKAGYALILCGSDNDIEKDYHALRAMHRQRVRGLIFVPAGDYQDDVSFEKLSGLLHQLDCPVVILDRPIDRLTDRDCVMTDNFRGAYIATETLINAGHRKVGIIVGDLNLSIGRERLDGYRSAMAQNGLEVLPENTIFGEFRKETTYIKVKKLLETGVFPGAFFISNNFSEAGFLIAVNEMGMRIPDDIAFIGFDEMQGQSVFSLPYSCLDREVLKMGTLAAQLLFRRFDTPGFRPEKVVMVPNVVLRGSERRISAR